MPAVPPLSQIAHLLPSPLAVAQLRASAGGMLLPPFPAGIQPSIRVRELKQDLQRLAGSDPEALINLLAVLLTLNSGKPRDVKRLAWMACEGNNCNQLLRS